MKLFVIAALLFFQAARTAPPPPPPNVPPPPAVDNQVQGMHEPHISRVSQPAAEKAQAQAVHQRLLRDTEELAALVAEVKRYVDATGGNAVSPAMLEKSKRIEELAKSVRRALNGK